MATPKDTTTYSRQPYSLETSRFGELLLLSFVTWFLVFGLSFDSGGIQLNPELIKFMAGG